MRFGSLHRPRGVIGLPCFNLVEQLIGQGVGVTQPEIQRLQPLLPPDHRDRPLRPLPRLFAAARRTAAIQQEQQPHRILRARRPTHPGIRHPICPLPSPPLDKQDPTSTRRLLCVTT